MDIKRSLKNLYIRIVKEKASPQYIARGWAIGMFYGCMIPFGLQLVCSIPTAFLLKGSKIGATLGTLITNHITIFFIYPVQCYVGNHLIGGNLSYEKVSEAMQQIISAQSYQALMALGWDLVISFFVGGLLLTLIMTPLTYVAVYKMVTEHRQRKKRKSPQNTPDTK